MAIDKRERVAQLAETIGNELEGQLLSDSLLAVLIVAATYLSDLLEENPPEPVAGHFRNLRDTLMVHIDSGMRAVALDDLITN